LLIPTLQVATLLQHSLAYIFEYLQFKCSTKAPILKHCCRHCCCHHTSNTSYFFGTKPGYLYACTLHNTNVTIVVSLLSQCSIHSKVDTLQHAAMYVLFGKHRCTIFFSVC
jgi:hypothetical protein